MENGRGIGDNILQRLCTVFAVTEDAFTLPISQEESTLYGTLPDVTKMILEELRLLPEYEQFRLLADLKEKRTKSS
jgi:hypothetical protein